MTYLVNRNFLVDSSGDLVLTTSPPTSDNSTDVATTAYVQALLAQSGYNANNVSITGGSINNTPIGNATPSTGAFTTGSFSGTLTATNVTVNGTLTLLGSVVENTRVSISGNVLVGANDVVIVVHNSTPAATTVTLPGAPAVGRYVVVKDGGGIAASFNITVTGGAIDGGTSAIINTNYSSLAMVYNGSSWSIIT